MIIAKFKRTVGQSSKAYVSFDETLPRDILVYLTS